MRNISFFITTQQVVAKQKATTRRFGWDNIKPDEHLQGVNKCQGLKHGEHPVKLTEIVAIGSQWEPLGDIIKRPVRKAQTQREWLAYRQCCPRCQIFRTPCLDENYNILPCDFEHCPGIPEVALEGFPFMTPEEFVEMLIRSHRKATKETPVNRIVFEYVLGIK